MDPPATFSTPGKRSREDEEDENGGGGSILDMKRLRLQQQPSQEQSVQQHENDSDEDDDDEDEESEEEVSEEEEVSGEEDDEEEDGAEVDNNNQHQQQQPIPPPSFVAAITAHQQQSSLLTPQQQQQQRYRSNSFEVNLGPSTQPPRALGDGPPLVVQKMKMMAQAAAQAAAQGVAVVDPSSLQMEPTSNDVLLHPRHGMDFPQFAGNMKLNFLIQQERSKYLSSDHATRAMMIQGVVAIINQLDPPGRFLKYKGDGNWIEVSNEYAYMQVLQMFIRQPQEQQQQQQPQGA